MNIVMLRSFFLWCTLFGGGLLIFSSLLCMVCGDWVYRLHSRWFPLPRETFNALIYGVLGVFKILVLIFFLVPYLALLMVG